MSTVFTTEVQRRVRLKNAEKFDLQEALGESVIIYVGELPQSQQPKVIAFASIRQELVEFAKTQQQKGESTEEAVKRLGAELMTEEALEAAKALGESLSRRLLTVMQELIGAALLDANGDRLSADDARAMFDLLPATRETAALIQRMSEAVLARIGGSKRPKPQPADGAPTEPPK